MKYANNIVSTKKSTASITVAFERKASIPRAFCLPINCSAPPEIAPDSPALRPDCNKTTVIKAIAVKINNTIKMVVIVCAPPKYDKGSRRTAPVSRNYPYFILAQKDNIRQTDLLDIEKGLNRLDSPFRISLSYRTFLYLGKHHVHRVDHEYEATDCTSLHGLYVTVHLF